MLKWDRKNEKFHFYLSSSDLIDQDVSYPVDDEASLQAPPIQLALLFALYEAQEVLRVELQEFVQDWEELLHRQLLQLHLLLQAFAVHLRHDAQSSYVVHLRLHQFCRHGANTSCSSCSSKRKLRLSIRGV